jgi:hypothetical protein
VTVGQWVEIASGGSGTSDDSGENDDSDNDDSQ